MPAHETPTGRRLCDTVLGPLVISLGLAAEYQTVANSRELVSKLAGIRRACIEQNEGPIIHIEAHGTEDHLRLANGDEMTWEDLRSQFTEINAACRMNLLVVMAMCKGAYLGRILRPMFPAPTWGIVGPVDDIYDSDLLDGMKAFYQETLGMRDLIEAVAAMNAAKKPRTPTFEFLSAEFQFWKAFRSYSADGDPAAIRQRAEDIVMRMMREKGATVDQTPVLRQQFIEQLSDQRVLFNKYRKTFLLLDQFPENELRFPLTFDDYKLQARSNSAP